MMQAPFPFTYGCSRSSVDASTNFLSATADEFPSMQASTSFHPQLAVEFPSMQAPISFQLLQLSFQKMRAPFFHSTTSRDVVFPMASHCSSHSTGVIASGHVGKPT
jgi:hypothetical protein